MPIIPRDKSLKPYSHDLRNNATKQENHLWYGFLRTYLLHFCRQRIIGEYIADFYCPKAKLVIELDGSQHYEYEKQKQDEKRTGYIHRFGLKVLRFSNREIGEQFQEICEMIDAAVKQQMDIE